MSQAARPRSTSAATSDPLTPPGQAELYRAALGRAYVVLSRRDWPQQRALISSHLRELLGASAVRAFEQDVDGKWRSHAEGDGLEIPGLAAEMEEALLPRALAAGKSLLSTHPALHPELADLADLAASCTKAGITTHVLLVRVEGRTHAAFAAHWLGCERASYEYRVGFYLYWDTISSRSPSPSSVAAPRRSCGRWRSGPLSTP